MKFGTRGRELVQECKNHSNASGGNSGGSEGWNDRASLLPPYNDEGVRATLQEITWHCDELTIQVESLRDGKPSLESRPCLLLHDASIRRNKRCLLAYMNYRADVIRKNPVVYNNLAILQQQQQQQQQQHDDMVNDGISSRKNSGGNSNEIGSKNNINNSNDDSNRNSRTSGASGKPILSEAERDFLREYRQLRAGYCDRVGMEVSHERLPPQDQWVQVRVVRPLGEIVLSETGSAVRLEEGTIHYLPFQDVEDFLKSGDLRQIDGEECGSC